MERALVLCAWTADRHFDLPTMPAGSSAMDATGQPAENVPPDANVLVVEVWAETAYVDSLGDAVIRRGPLDGSEEPTDNSVLSALDAVGVVWTGPRNPHGPTVVTVADVLPWLKALTKGP